MEKNETLALIRAEYDRLDKITGVDTRQVELRLSTRMTRKLGCLSVTKKNIFAAPKLSIAISVKIIPENGSPDVAGFAGKISDGKSNSSEGWDLFMDVIRHEYAHAVCYLRYPAENHGHDRVWKGICREVGCNPKATQKFEAVEYRPRPYKYAIACCRCGAISKYKTESKIVKIAEGKLSGRIVCSKCGAERFTVTKLQ